MRRLSLPIVAVLGIITSSYALGDTQNVEVGYLCDSSNDRLEFRYFYYENGSETLQKSDVDPGRYERIYPSRLVTYTNSPNKPSVKKQETVTKYCKLKNATYKVEISPASGNIDALSRCGGTMTASVKISEPPWYAVKEPKVYASEDGDIILNRYSFEGDCHEEAKLITKSIVFESAIERVTITTVNALSMHRPLAETKP